jgi:hypothetical protein
MGVCIFGQGDCSTTINNVATEFNNNFTQNISTQLVNFASSLNAITQNAQTITITDLNLTGCSFNASGLNQTTVAKFNFSQMANALTQDKFNTMMTAAATSAVQNTSSLSSGFLSGTGSQNVNNNTSITNNNLNQLISSVSVSDVKSMFNQLANMQNITISGITETCPASNPTFNISDISQTITMDIIAQQISSAVTAQLVSMLQQNSSDLKATNNSIVTNTGLFQDLFSGLSNLVSSSQYWVYAIVLIFIVLIVGIVYAVSSGGEEPAPSPAGQARG